MSSLSDTPFQEFKKYDKNPLNTQKAFYKSAVAPLETVGFPCSERWREGARCRPCSQRLLSGLPCQGGDRSHPRHPGDNFTLEHDEESLVLRRRGPAACRGQWGCMSGPGWAGASGMTRLARSTPSVCTARPARRSGRGGPTLCSEMLSFCSLHNLGSVSCTPSRLNGRISPCTWIKTQHGQTEACSESGPWFSAV